MSITKEFLQSIIDSIKDSIKIVDKDRTIIFINKAARETVGERIATILGSKCYKEFWHRDGPCPHCMMDETFKTGQPQSATVKIDSSEASTVTVELNTFPIEDDRGEIVYGIETIRDVTEREMLMNELVQNRTLAILGKYSAELTHEIKNPLNAIAIQSHLIQKIAEKVKGSLQNEVKDIARVLREEVERLNNLSREYLQITKSPPLELGKNSIQQVIQDVCDLVQPYLAHSRIDVRTELDREPVEIFIDSNKMKQVFLNIINNAAEAMAQGGMLSISMRKKPASLVVAFSDNGGGILPENRDKIYQPFFSTKKDGTGLGLTVAHNIVQAHGGSIWFETGTTTTFFVELPRAYEEENITITE